MRRVSAGSTVQSNFGRSSFKKKHSLPLPSPPKNGSSGDNNHHDVNIYSHIRTPSDPVAVEAVTPTSGGPIYAQIKTRSSGNWRTRSIDNSSGIIDTKPIPAPKVNLNGSYSSSSSSASKHAQQSSSSIITVTASSNTTTSINTPSSSALYASLQRPRVPPPPLPPHQTKTTPLRTNSIGRQEDYPLMDADLENNSLIRSSIPLPVPPPRRVRIVTVKNTALFPICMTSYIFVACMHK